ncbi:MAG: ABC transporter permease [Lentisphaeria bacterium]
MITALFQIAKNTFRESLREPIFLLLLFTALCMIGLFPIFTMFVFRAQEKLVMDSSMATMMVMGWALAILISSYAVSREIDNGTVLLLLSKPVQRPVFIIAKIIGILGAITIFCFVTGLAGMISLRVAADQFRLDLYVMSVYFGGIVLAFIIGGIYNYITRASFPMATILAILVIMPLVAIFAHFLPYEGERIGLSFKLVPALILIYYSVLAMGCMATALSTRLNLVSNLLVCCVIFLLGLMSDYISGRKAWESWMDTPPQSKQALWYSSYTFASTELANVGKWSPPQKIDVGEAMVIWSDNDIPDTLPKGLGKTPEAVWNDNETWKNDIKDLQKPACYMAIYNVDTQDWEKHLISNERTSLKKNAKGMDASYTSYAFRRSMNTPRIPKGGTWYNPIPDPGSRIATITYVVVPNWQLFWMADALANNLAIPGEYLALGTAYAAIIITMMIIVAVLLFWNREVGKQMLTS